MITFREWGSGVPLVLMHGFGNDSSVWQAQLDAFSTRCRVIAPDLRGFGNSSGADGAAISMDEYAGDVLELLDALGIQSAVIGGISMGGYVSLAMALNHPERVRGLVLANTRAGADNPEWAEFREALARDITQRGAIAVVEGMGDKPLRADCTPAIRAQLRDMYMRQSAAALASATRGMASRPDRTARLGDLHVPALVIGGTADVLIPSSEGLVIHRAVAGSQFVDIEGAGHLSCLDTPQAFNDALDAFLVQFQGSGK